MRLAQSSEAEDGAWAGQMAATYQLVTPVSGAVVLESQEQYDEAGLKPVSPTASPRVVPEPGTWALLALGALVMFLARLSRERRRLRRPTFHVS